MVGCRHSSVDSFAPVVPGSNPKHTIQVCIFHYSQLYHIFYYTEKKDENIQKKFYGTGPWQHEGGQRRESVHAMPGRAGVGWRGGVAVIGWFDLTHLLQFLEMRMTKECSLLELLRQRRRQTLLHFCLCLSFHSMGILSIFVVVVVVVLNGPKQATFFIYFRPFIIIP